MAVSKCRVDSWLWAVRIFKSRSKATDACKSGKVKINGEAVKASRLILENEVVLVRKGAVKYQFRVKQLLSKRVGAKLVPDYMEDITPPEELANMDANNAFPSAFRERGSGRPTKKERRDIESWKM